MESRTLDDLLAERFHDTYERLAPAYGYRTRPDSAVPWAEVPFMNKALMRAVVAELRVAGYVVVPYPGGDNCPGGCTWRQIGKALAECSVCEDTKPLDHPLNHTHDCGEPTNG